VLAALREPRLAAGDAHDTPSAQRAIREAAGRDLAPDRLARWRAEFGPLAQQLAAALPTGTPVDLLAGFARPWSLELALAVTGAPRAHAAELAQLAREVFLAAASTNDGVVHPQARVAASELARSFPGTAATLGVQSFIALSQTLPHFLAAAWLTLFGDPTTNLLLRAAPDLMPDAAEELLRHAGPSRAVFRHALADVHIGPAHIRSGDRVVLVLAAANHDPARFPTPDQLDLRRTAKDHVAFGRGAHACSGAGLVRLATAVATEALLGAAESVELAGPVHWIDGFAIRVPASLIAVLARPLYRSDEA
jgi:cytochrome P450